MLICSAYRRLLLAVLLTTLLWGCIALVLQ